MTRNIEELARDSFALTTTTDGEPAIFFRIPSSDDDKVPRGVTCQLNDAERLIQGLTQYANEGKTTDGNRKSTNNSVVDNILGSLNREGDQMVFSDSKSGHRYKVPTSQVQNWTQTLRSRLNDARVEANRRS